MGALITRLVTQQSKITPAELIQIVDYIALTPFATDLLQADEALWGSFWHFDVISPGYMLPALELNLLRATQLDHHWPETTTIEQFLADLRQAIRHPQAGIWLLLVAEQPCLIFAAPLELELKIKNSELLTVIWYCASTGKLHAGYRTTNENLRFENAVRQRRPGYQQQRPARFQKPGRSKNSPPGWLASAVEQIELTEASPLAARLDAEILRRRLGK